MGQFNSYLSSIWAPWIPYNLPGPVAYPNPPRISRVEKKLQRKKREEFKKFLQELAQSINYSQSISSSSDTVCWNTRLCKDFSWYDKTEPETSEGNQGDSKKD